MEDLEWRARALIDLSSLRHNIGQIRLAAPQSRLMAVIKADAYGHGLHTVCRAVDQWVDGFAVATIAEGIQCRETQDTRPIIVLSEFWDQAQLALFDEYQMQPVVHNVVQAKWLHRYRGKPLSLWIKVDSGMNRLGIAQWDLGEIFSGLKTLKCVKTIRIMSHLANADILGDNTTTTQLDSFLAATNTFDCEKSISNSAGVMAWPETNLDWARPGLMLYGASPFDQSDELKFELKPVMQLQARLIAIKTIGSGEPVGYGGQFRTRRKTTIAMVGLGYGDGYPRLVDSRAVVLINGQKAPIIGRVSMDMITVDITDLTEVAVGNEVTLWGHGLKIEEVANWAGTIPYELMCKVTTRIPRIAVENSQNFSGTS